MFTLRFKARLKDASTAGTTSFILIKKG